MTERTDIGMLIVLALTSGVGAASINIAARFTTDTGDILGFAGGALGAGLAVTGAYYLERFKSSDTLSKQIRVAGDSLAMLYKRASTPVDLTNYKTLAKMTPRAVRLVQTSLNALNTNDAFLSSNIATFEYTIPLMIDQLNTVGAVSEGEDESVQAIRVKVVTLCLEQIRAGIDFLMDEDDVIVKRGFWPRDVQGAIARMRQDCAPYAQSSTAAGSKVCETGHA